MAIVKRNGVAAILFLVVRRLGALGVVQFRLPVVSGGGVVMMVLVIGAGAPVGASVLAPVVWVVVATRYA